MGRRRHDPRQYVEDNSQLLKVLAEDYPVRPLVVREQPALAVLFKARQDMPNSAFFASRDTVAVYGVARKGDTKAGLLGSIGVDLLEKHPKGTGMRLRIAKSYGGTQLTAEQVDEMRRLAVGEPRRPWLSRPSALAERAFAGA